MVFLVCVFPILLGVLREANQHPLFWTALGTWSVGHGKKQSVKGAGTM